jgi:hypothetical protein
MAIQVWNGSSKGYPYWYVWVDGVLIGWYPTNIFDWDDAGTHGDMVNGPATYAQFGGEVMNVWPTGKHTGSSMGSDYPASYGCGYAAFHRDSYYLDADGGYNAASLTFHKFPAFEGDKDIGGLCGLFSGGFTNDEGWDGGYSLSSTPSPCSTAWNNYFYFGGGILEH